ncbi:DEAD/DEAH box helicase [Sporolactobacillus terrae]|uniref:helicase-related protein n=1 Tax=Sporolactobacillus terrae TaxID=269673 RepID=UPI000491D63D|nr:DEAD/DEAH box helicase [Sporolactobacillus terrae]
MDYGQFLHQKEIKIPSSGIEIKRSELHERLFDFQKDIVKWALKKGKAAVFAGTGLGKTLMQLEWSRQIYIKTNHNVLILAPLAVSSQTVREAQKMLNVIVRQVRQDSDVQSGINIANYEIIHKLDLNKFGAVVLDESSILKSFTGKVRTQIIEGFEKTPYKLACTATPAPNDFMELGNHSEFLNVMKRIEMLAMFFVHDGGSTKDWRLKGHAVDKFWDWVSEWAVMINKPSDIGYEDGKYNLPALNMNEVIIPAKAQEGYLIPVQAETLMERRRARKQTIKERCERAVKLANSTDEQFLVWCDLNDESKLLSELIPDAVEITGSDTNEHKAQAMMDFSDGKIRVLVTKPKIAGMGMNWQGCHNMAFVGLSDSFEQVYQAIRRCWRFGQEHSVNVYLVTSELEGSTLANIKRKQKDFEKMQKSMSKYSKKVLENVQSTRADKTIYSGLIDMRIPEWLKEEVA